MRRARHFILLTLLVLLLAGCEEMEDIAGLFNLERPEASLPSAYIVPTPEATFPPQMTTAARILARGEMVVGVRYDLEPFSFISDSSELVGFEIDLARELARRWLGSPDAVRFRQVRSDSAFQHLETGMVDFVLAGVSHTQEAEARADFSPPYFMNGLALLTFPDTQINTMGDVQDEKIGVVDWTGSFEQLQSTFPISAPVVTFESYFDVVDALRMREIDAYVDQRHRLERARRTVSGSTIVAQTTWEPISLLFRQDDPFFRNLVHLTFQDMVMDGTRDALYARWLPNTSPPALPYLAGQAPTPTLTASPAQLSTLDVAGRIRSRGTLAAGYFADRWPYAGDRTDGVPTGFEIRLVERMAEIWLGSRQAVTFVPVTSQDALTRLQAGEVDMLLGGWVHTRQLELHQDFSLPIVDDGVSILSLASHPFSEISQLRGQAVGVVIGSDGEAALLQLAQGSGLASTGYPDFAAARDGLLSGEVVAVLTERQPALEVHFRQEDYAFTDQRWTRRPVAFVLPEGDSAFTDMVNLTLGVLE
ncbi:MAG: transporter substrate-binding domain-containing protein, partial [Anaerolineae bacterium]|nr:transporter substrate-binding domain-containing protein [Anaerolineae bacterium]